MCPGVASGEDVRYNFIDNCGNQPHASCSIGVFTLHYKRFLASPLHFINMTVPIGSRFQNQISVSHEGVLDRFWDEFGNADEALKSADADGDGQVSS